jgi:DNA-binding LacI/PurR family transcriptional regulator
MAASARLGYRANWAARALACHRSRLVGIMLCTQHGALIEIARSLEARLTAEGYACLIGFPSAQDQPAASARLAERGCEALVYVGGGPAAGEPDALAARSLPWIAVADGSEGAQVAIGRERGGELAARYLVDLNHERFAVIEQPPASTARGAARALEAPGLTVAEIPERGDDPNSVKRAIHGLLDLPRSPTALLCGSDEIALVAVRECTLRGRRVPGDISIVGFGDEPYARCALPSLTTVRTLTFEAGVHAAEAVLGLLEGQSFGPWEPTVKLAIRESTGPAP